MSKHDSELDPILISGHTLNKNLDDNLDVEILLSSMIDILKSSSEKILGFSKKKNLDLFNESSQDHKQDFGKNIAELTPFL